MRALGAAHLFTYMLNFDSLQKLWTKDARLWSKDPATQVKIQTRLGFLDVPSFFTDKIQHIQNTASVQDYTHVVLLGMGGSSLAAKCYLQQVQPAPKRSFHVLDTTNPFDIDRLTHDIPLSETLFLVASKSGSTLEVQSLFKYFWHLCPNPKQFWAITDPHTPLHQQALDLKFSHIWLNPPDIGGRFSALSYFGLIPLALMGIDLEAFWNDFLDTLTVLKSKDSPILPLAQFLAQAHSEHVHKLYLTTTESTHMLAQWIAQLIGESLGKNNMGFLPIPSSLDENACRQSYIHALGSEDEFEAMASKTAHSVSTINGVFDLGGEFYFWMCVTALLGAHLKINPFDQPHVELAKQKTKAYLNQASPEQNIKLLLKKHTADPHKLKACIEQTPTDHMVCVLSYLPQSMAAKSYENKIIKDIQDYRPDVFLTKGPQYLHSTGQYYKGGKNNATYIILTQKEKRLALPQSKLDFNTINLAQALGDYHALTQQKRSVTLVHLS